MSDEKVEKKEEDSPQTIEMKQTIQELTTRLEQASGVISESTKKIEELQKTKEDGETDRLEKEKNLRAKFGVHNSEVKKSPEDINSMTNTELLEVVADAVTTMVDATREQSVAEVNKGFEGLEAKFDNIQGTLLKTEASIALDKVRTDNKDFDEYKEQIREVLKKHQSFSYQDAYDWVKFQKAKGVIATKHTDSEKPNVDLSTADKAVERTKKAVERKISSKRQFRINIEEAIDRVQARRAGGNE